MKDRHREAERWLRQAENDLLFAETGLRDGFFAQTCFICQQVAEKAAKAVHYVRGARFIPGHSVFRLLSELNDEELSGTDLLRIAGQLDQYYIPARYPNGLPDGAPFEVYSEDQARQAIDGARLIFSAARKACEQAL